ncbi:hypothetical protein AbraIFM66951_007482 [Aspergillus brasiliensis]|uniref:Extracellular membrane protein CFEM domain-containing protein n=2 Tax=Aspergillus brasiliensis TaxID=319629 RepID=A0A1L9UT66_ASPBC|nr:hypothetical protein ASPBRDRAFT_193639 [Aspergillus brasiliensis CBS 101740]GKZ22229.1 hypothetical protein AbraCBS73388_008179 [Aspergillus brasiliensis]GKZ37774.1 hypothetical protein AbraIFM66950_009532 [Aspergillus brasiliensis]GKZ45101.1 hypothetical protein AbraIFM66951_007482 [Aspergillus brasiliensis]
MKFNSAIALSSLLALAVAQDSSSTTSSATTTASLSPQASCATKCSETDICCVAQCYSVPCPDNAQANDTTSCVAACPQGSGSPSDQRSYASCQSSCYSSYFFPASATGASGSQATTAGSNDASTTKSGSSSSSTGSSSNSKSGSSGTSTATGAHASSTENAAAIAQLKLGVSAAGVLGFVLAAWAL